MASSTLSIEEAPKETSEEAQNNASSSTILDLITDCLEELFDWLSLRDIRALRQTCKQMKHTTDCYIQRTYPTGFGKLIIQEDDPAVLRNFHPSFCKLFKRLQFNRYGPLSDDQIPDLKTILNHVEQLVIESVEMETDFYENFLQICTQLKYLQIERFYELTESVGFNWLLRKCPTLEHLVLIDDYMDDEDADAPLTPQLKIFLEQNPNIHRLTIDPRFIANNFAWMIESDIHLDQLDVVMDSRNSLLAVMYCAGLETLYERGFYKKLHLYVFGRYEQQDLYEFQTLSALEKLQLGHKLKQMIWPTMPQLKDFCIDCDYRFNVDEFIENFPNIERVYLDKASFDIVLPLIQRSTTLKEINIFSPYSDTFCNDNVIDLPALNKERQKCTDGTKITVCVKEMVYLNTKRALMKTEFGLIQLKRIELHSFLNPFNVDF